MKRHHGEQSAHAAVIQPDADRFEARQEVACKKGRLERISDNREMFECRNYIDTTDRRPCEMIRGKP